MLKQVINLAILRAKVLVCMARLEEYGNCITSSMSHPLSLLHREGLEPAITCHTPTAVEWFISLRKHLGPNEVPEPQGRHTLTMANYVKIFRPSLTWCLANHTSLYDHESFRKANMVWMFYEDPCLYLLVVERT